MALSALGLRSESLPFDYISSNLDAINYYLSTQDISTFTSTNSDGFNDTGCWIGHFVEKEGVKDIFQRKFDRLFAHLHEPFEFTFIYSCTSIRHLISTDTYASVVSDSFRKISEFENIIQSRYGVTNYKILFIDNVDAGLDVPSNNIHYYSLDLLAPTDDQPYFAILLEKLESIRLDGV
ncbi:unnamed protein product [Sphagnum jensenii]